MDKFFIVFVVVSVAVVVVDDDDEPNHVELPQFLRDAFCFFQNSFFIIRKILRQF